MKCLKINKLEMSGIPELQRKFSLSELIQDILDIFLPAINDSSLQIETEYDKNLPEMMIGNDLLLHQVMMNLMSNAIKFTDTGSVKIVAKLLRKTDKQIIIELIIEDTGLGIPTEKQESIFLPFNTLSNKEKYKGSGLGLYLVAEYIRQLGGEIHVESELGKGSVFHCIIPFTRTLSERK